MTTTTGPDPSTPPEGSRARRRPHRTGPADDVPEPAAERPAPAEPVPAGPGGDRRADEVREPVDGRPAPAGPAGREPLADVPAEQEPGREPAADGRIRRSAGTQAPAESGLQRLAPLLGLIAAPTGLVTALLYYFGYNYAYFFFGYLGVDSTTLGLTTVDYLRRIVDPLFIPLTVIAGVGLVLLWAHAELRPRLTADTSRRLARRALPLLALAGLVLTGAGVLSVFTTTPLLRYLTAAPLSLAAGVLLLAYAVHLRRWLRRTETPGDPPAAMAMAAEWALVFLLVGISLFWAVADYSAATGVSRARWYATRLHTLPDVVLYSEKGLNLTGPGVREVRCTAEDTAYGFRYEGLKLMLRSGDQYLFVPAKWTTANGSAFVLPRGGSLRLEFTRPTGPRAPRPAC